MTGKLVINDTEIRRILFNRVLQITGLHDKYIEIELCLYDEEISKGLKCIVNIKENPA